MKRPRLGYSLFVLFLLVTLTGPAPIPTRGVKSRGVGCSGSRPPITAPITTAEESRNAARLADMTRRMEQQQVKPIQFRGPGGRPFVHPQEEFGRPWNPNPSGFPGGMRPGIRDPFEPFPGGFRGIPGAGRPVIVEVVPVVRSVPRSHPGGDPASPEQPGRRPKAGPSARREQGLERTRSARTGNSRA